jgi:hypothetical protein
VFKEVYNLAMGIILKIREDVKKWKKSYWTTDTLKLMKWLVIMKYLI